MKNETVIANYDKWLAKKKKPLITRITWLFKKWIVKRNKGQCQILIPLIELDDFVQEICKEL